MRRIIAEEQNHGKALEIRLEQEGHSAFYVILAGMTFNIRTGCASGVFEPTGEDEYMVIENDTYKAYNFRTYGEAKKAYDIFKAQYID